MLCSPQSNAFLGGTMRLALAFLGLVASTGAAFGLEFDRYHTQDEINGYMAQVAAEHPELVQKFVLGTSEEGREIAYLVISKAHSTAPAIQVNGTHHGNERSSTESALGFIQRMVEARDEADVTALLENYRVVVQPLVNPDGHAANTREDPRGRDPNRDYSYPQRDDAASFRSPVIALEKTLLDEFRFKAAIALHSGMVGVLWPWCYTGGTARDRDVFHALSERSAQAMGFDYFTQSYFDYPSNGEFIDYAYMRHGTWAVTIEVSEAATPSAGELADVVGNAVDGMVSFFSAVLEHDRGDLPTPPVALDPMVELRGFNPRFAQQGEKRE